MAVWPFLMALTAGLAVWGYRHDAWVIPVIALAGYVAMRGVVAASPPEFVEIAGCTSWLIFSALMMYKGGYIPGFFYALSALTYPALLLIGFRLEFMGLSPIIAEIFAAFALLSIGGGIYGMAHNSSPDSGRLLHWFSSYSMGLAAR